MFAHRELDLLLFSIGFTAVVVLLVAIFHFALRKVAAARQLLVSVLIFVLGVAWHTNTALALQRGGYCKTLPMWPPFSGRAVDAPQVLMAFVALITVASMPMLLISCIRLWRNSRTKSWRLPISH